MKKIKYKKKQKIPVSGNKSLNSLNESNVLNVLNPSKHLNLSSAFININNINNNMGRIQSERRHDKSFAKEKLNYSHDFGFSIQLYKC